MNKSYQPYQEAGTQLLYKALRFLQRHWFKALIVLVLLHVAIQKDLSMNVRMHGIADLNMNRLFNWIELTETTKTKPVKDAAPLNTSLVSNKKTSPKKTVLTSNKSKNKKNENLANTYSNLTYTAKEFATSDSDRKRLEKIKKQKNYIQQYAEAAQAEMQKYGIPASITLAQGILESNAGESPLAVKNNNHFGIKCFSRTCRKGHCSNFTDDSHKDFFRIYKNTSESFRGHSILLQKDRYRKLYQLDIKDYKGWAKGLKKAGYATDPHYAEKLINLIERLNLQAYD